MIAQLLGVSVSTVNHLAQDGIIHTELPPEGGRRKYLTCQTVQRYIAHIKQKSEDSSDDGKTATLKLKKLEAEVKLKESQGQLASIQADIAGGRYIETAIASEQLTEFMETFKNFALNIPARVAGTVAGFTDAASVRAVETAVRKELEDMFSLFVSAAVLLPKEHGP